MNQSEPLPASSATLLQRVLDLTEAISQATELADWREAARLSELRLPLLLSIRAEPGAPVPAVVRRVQMLDAAIQERSSIWKTELNREFQALIAQARGASAYQAAARL